MNYLHRVEHWGDAHHPKYLDLLRIAFGIFLCFKGIEYGRDSTMLNEVLGGQVPFDSFVLLLLSHYVIFSHVMGGFLLAAGLLTRFACIVQMPILLMALVFGRIDLTNHLSTVFLSLVILGLLIYFAIIGSGPWSLDRALGKEEK